MIRVDVRSTFPLTSCLQFRVDVATALGMMVRTMWNHSCIRFF